MATNITTDIYITKSIAKHGHRFDYSGTTYTGMNNKVLIHCIEHNQTSEVRAAGHLRGNSGCRKCRSQAISSSKFLTKDQFIERAVTIHGNRYDYSDLVYTGVETKMTIICSVHGPFEQFGQNHIHKVNKAGCKKCGISSSVHKQSTTFEEFVVRAQSKHGNLYSYSKPNDYKNIVSKVDVKCQEHGWFQQTAEVHLRGHGCVACKHFVSKAETSWLDSLDIPTKWRQWKHFNNEGRMYLLDACDIQNKIVWEFYGDFWHGNPNTFTEDHINPMTRTTYGELYKRTLAREAELKGLGFQLITIWEYDYNQELRNRQNQPPSNV